MQNAFLKVQRKCDFFDILETAVFTYKEMIPNTNDTKFIKRLFLKCCLSRNKAMVSFSLDMSSKFYFVSFFFKILVLIKFRFSPSWIFSLATRPSMIVVSSYLCGLFIVCKEVQYHELFSILFTLIPVSCVLWKRSMNSFGTVKNTVLLCYGAIFYFTTKLTIIPSPLVP